MLLKVEFNCERLNVPNPKPMYVCIEVALCGDAHGVGRSNWAKGRDPSGLWVQYPNPAVPLIPHHSRWSVLTHYCAFSEPTLIQAAKGDLFPHEKRSRVTPGPPDQLCSIFKHIFSIYASCHTPTSFCLYNHKPKTPFSFLHLYCQLGSLKLAGLISKHPEKIHSKTYQDESCLFLCCAENYTYPLDWLLQE